MCEVWKDIFGYEGLYQVSTLGRVKSLGNRSNHRNEIILKPAVVQGYLKVNLYKNSKGKIWSIHRLVALTFLKNSNNKPEVNHIDGNKKNNCLDNLEWNTKNENQKHCVATGLRRPKKSFECKLSVQIAKVDIKTNKILHVYGSYREAERITGVAHSNIKKCVKGYFKQMGGYKWIEV